ncbi:MAG: segregation/condensation protein A [Cyclobacteriaceae bacterium]|nr:segregation/condensation protein A [Cyclobacteriaceae bacterium]
MSFEVKLPLFEGPFDLLLFFIERDELDIYDIPISKITDDFLGYLHQLEKLNIEVASEFILVAAKLMRIKAKMLLPRPQLDEEGNEIDPREELVRHLLEYKKYKSVVDEFAQMEENQLCREKRGNILKEIRLLSETVNVESELQDLDLYKLMRIYQKVLQRYDLEQSKPTHQVVPFPYTIEEQKIFLIDKLVQNGRMSFLEIVSLQKDKIAIIFNFLALLELLQLNEVHLSLGEGFNNFWITHTKGEFVS